MSAVQGVDVNGCVLTVADAPIQPEFQSLLADVRASLSPAGLGLHSVYLYGSVARGDASPGESDLDLTLVLTDPPDAQVLEQLEQLRQALEQRHEGVTKIDFDIGHRAEVLAPENRNRWGFWLKHHCRCLWGDDLSLRFEPFAPSRDIALALNGDFEPVLNGYLTRIEHASSAPERLRLQREAARKLIRSTHTLRAADASGWPQTLEEHVALFVQHYPTMRIQIAYFLFEARNPSAEREAFFARLQAFVSWMVSVQA
ncbi:nucleotidyltransferase domain-containing protein [Pseudomonas sp. ArH3a]|uniref:nucleotidyltransferase domain-containing protein n=1 Tax=Pseudomonas TaxID=286 RepID=UPI000BA071DF|nr:MULTISPECIES: nucleotidyltransferase domain-containing protein [unclassified Pseudomonas]MCV2228732.1 nucleotidyltransferase domain-containing protein [Pseudomonas sp. AU10]OZO04988.1 DNA polymerase III subunit beta [Pseudomonas sp. IB20]UNM17401.1 nucleotidyltransferase domain-containing protein [Pseudomonas sp. ArH3a]